MQSNGKLIFVLKIPVLLVGNTSISTDRVEPASNSNFTRVNSQKSTGTYFMLPTHHIHTDRSVKMDDPLQAHLAQTPTVHTYRHS